jgi:U4/U6 small nuclear ribonucleoprotein PRP31
MFISGLTSATEIAKIYGSQRLKGIIEDIEQFIGKDRKTEDISGPVEADPEYMLIVDANALTVDIDNDLG